MSIKIMTMVWDCEFPSLTAKMIVLKMADHADDAGCGIFPAVNTLARAAGAGRSTVLKWLHALEYSGLLTVNTRSSGGAKHCLSCRSFDMDLLREFAAGDLKMVKSVVERPDMREGKTGLVKAVVLEFSPVDRPMNDAENNPTRPRGGPLPVHAVDPYPSTKRELPVHEVDSTRPRGGPEPSLNRQLEPSLSQQVENSGRDGADIQPENERESSAQAPDYIFDFDQLRASPQAGQVIEEFILPLQILIQHPQSVGATAGQFWRTLIAALKGFNARALGDASAELIGKRAKFPSINICVETVERMAAGVNVDKSRAETSVLIKTNTRQSAAWLKYLARHDPVAGDKLRRWLDQFGAWRVPSEWPPAKSAGNTTLASEAPGAAVAGNLSSAGTSADGAGKTERVAVAANKQEAY